MADLNAFTAICTYRSFRKAADELGVSRSALSHTIRGLEQSLGVRLLNRTTRSVAPTDAGAHLLERLNPVLRDLDAALDALTDVGVTPSGLLRINANFAAARWLLAYVVPTFRSQYPDVELDLVSEGQLVDIVDHEFDAGVRLLEAVPQDMIAVPFGGDVRFVPVASPSYLSVWGRPQVPDDLMKHQCIRHRMPSGKRYRWEFSRAGQSLALDVPGMLTLDDSLLMVDAATEGLGIAFVAEPFAQSAVADGCLVRILEDWCPRESQLALYYPGHRHIPAALQVFIEVLRSAEANRRDAAERLTPQ
ncbi:LysR family transcriptional regulator [Marinobacter nanhaiticus]|uniref:LysR family transcriptional regulator n=1 Tax=Marinobacter nanhaiticus TaxID=1305740 RepID=UPI0030C7C228